MLRARARTVLLAGDFACVTLLACSARQPAPTREPTPALTAAPAASAPSGGELPARAEPAPSAKRPFQLELPWDAGFVGRALPTHDPSRYARWRESARIQVGKGSLTAVDRLSNGELVVLSTDDGGVRHYDGRSKRLLGSVAVPGFAALTRVSVAAWPGAEPRFVTAGPRGLLRFDALADRPSSVLDERPVEGLRWSPDGQLLVAVARGDREQTSVLHFYAKKGDRLARLGSLPFEERVDDWDLSPDNRLLALAHYPSNDARVLDLHTGAEVLRVPAPRYGGSVAFSPDGRLLAVGGDGLLLVDVLNPDRRAFFSYVKNNIGHVRFSPSGDAVFASAYDGRLRILGVEGPSERGLALRLLQELHHAGRANVYGFVFTPDGRGVISASGDQTVRVFSEPELGPAGTTATPPPPKTFHDLSAWRALDPRGAAPLSRPSARSEGGPYLPPAFALPARPSSIPEGRYACKITLIYKLRDCWVEKDEAGRSVLTFAPDNLLSLRGVLYDDGPVVRYEAALLEDGSVIDCAGCTRQPLFGVLRGAGKKYQGVLTFRTYYDPFVPPPEPPADVVIEEANDRFPIVLEWRAPLPRGPRH